MKYLFCDLDNTLFFNIDGEYKIKTDDINAIKKYKDEIRLIIASGRHNFACEKISKELNINVDSITLNGLCVTIDDKDIVLGSVNSNDFTDIIIDLSNKFNNLNFATITFDGKYLVQNLSKEPYFRFANHQKVGMVKEISLTCAIDYIKENNINELTKILIYVGDYEGNKNDVLEYVKSKYDNYDFIFSSEFFIEGLCKNIHKASGIEYYVDNKSINYDDCFCIGDSDNDIEMFELLNKNSFCINSGSSSAKSVANKLVDSVSSAMEIIVNDR